MSRSSSAVTVVDTACLRGWPLPEPGKSKRTRGDVVVVGGAARSPGAALLAGRAALRVGAGRLTLAVGESVAATIAAALPECGTVSLAQTSSGAVRAASLAAASADLRSADAVLIGPGLDDIAETRRMLRRLFALVDPGATVLLDAYALGAVAGKKHLGPARRILTPNIDEAHLLLGRREDDIAGAVMAIARRYRATVTCQGWVADPGGRLLRVEGGGPGLATSGSGDALAGAIAGLAARGCTPLQAAAWGTYLHTSAGETLARTVAPLGFLASEIVDRLPRELETIEASAD